MTPERNGYEAVIGLEIHVQLSTRTKMFCGCELSFGDDPNVHTCPVCLGHPGTLPVTNERAIQFALMIARALECEVLPRSIFHRKNYFYPDLPKGYQISQYDIPLASGGRLGDVRINRVHLEEDAAKLIHLGESGRIHGSGQSLVDFNRGGTPLVEIVTEPDLRGTAEARDWAQLLRTTIKQLGVSDVNMEEGSLRCDANVSLRPAGSEELGVKTELKNMNSFRFLERGIEAELERQGALLESGEAVTQDTLHFDPRTGSLTPLRSKEYAHDYRYFPEPDLVPLAPTEEMLRAAAEALPELPAHRRDRYRDELGLSDDLATQLAFEAELGSYFEAAVSAATDGADARRNRELGHRRARGRAAPGGRGGSSFFQGRAGGARDARRDGAGEAGHARRREAGARGARRRRRRSGRDRRGARPRPDLRFGRARGRGRAARSRPIRTRRSGSARATRRRSARSSAR